MAGCGLKVFGSQDLKPEALDVAAPGILRMPGSDCRLLALGRRRLVGPQMVGVWSGCKASF